MPSKLEMLDEALEMLEAALDDIDQAHARLLDIDRSWNAPAAALFKHAQKLLLEVEEARKEVKQEEENNG
jgi:hypothetical protein